MLFVQSKHVLHLILLVIFVCGLEFLQFRSDVLKSKLGFCGFFCDGKQKCFYYNGEDDDCDTDVAIGDCVYKEYERVVQRIINDRQKSIIKHANILPHLSFVGKEKCHTSLNITLCAHV